MDYPKLVSEVSNAGGLGMLAGARVSLERLREDILAVRARTAIPFGVNLLLAPPEASNKDTVSVQHFLDRFREELGLFSGETDLAFPPSSLSKQLEIVFEERVPVLGVALGEPGDLVEEAVLVAEGGAEVIIAQGAEAGATALPSRSTRTARRLSSGRWP